MFPPQIFQLTSGPLESQAAETVTKLRVGPGPVQHYHDSCVLQGVSKKRRFIEKWPTFKLIQNANVGGVLENSGKLLQYGH